MKREFSNRMKIVLIVLCGFSLLSVNQASARDEKRKVITIYGYDSALKLRANHPSKERYVLQANAFNSLEKAVKYKHFLASQVKVPIRITSQQGTHKIYHVLLGPFDSVHQLIAISKQLRSKKHTGIIKKHSVQIKTQNPVKTLPKHPQSIAVTNSPNQLNRPNNTAKPVITSKNEMQAITPKPSPNNLTQLLLDQVSLGEATFKEELIQQALERLDRIEPNNPLVIAAHIRLSLFQKNEKLAQQQLEQLKNTAPNSAIYHQSQMMVDLLKPNLKLQLQNAKLLALGGKFIEAKQAYDNLFHGVFPTQELATEYWVNAAKIPDENQEAYKHLEALYQAFEKQRVIANDLNTQRLQNSVRSSLASLLIKEGDLALKNANLALAEQKYKKAMDIDPKNSYAVIGLGDVSFEQQHYNNAEAFYRKALSIENTQLVHYRIASVLKKQSPQKALDYVHTLSKDNQEQMKSYTKMIEADIVQQESDALQQQAKQLEILKNWSQTIAKYEKALKLTPDDVWLSYHLASAFQKTGQQAKAITLFQKLAAKQPKNPQQVYAYALFLSNIDKNNQALTHLKNLPRNLWTKDIQNLSQRLTIVLAIEYAQKLRDKGDKKAANVYLAKQRQTVTVELKLANWAQEDKDYPRAIAYYKKIQSQDSKNFDAILGEIETYIASKQLAQARQHLDRLPPNLIGRSLNEQRRIANDWSAVGEPGKAGTIFQRLKSSINRSIQNQDNALIFRDAATLETKQNNPKEAKKDYAQAMVSSGITPELPQNNDVYTYLTRNQINEDWLKRGIRSDAAKLYRKEDTTITVNERFSQLAGTNGFSNLKASNTMTQADFPLFDGRAFLRDDFVKLNAGSFLTTNGVFTEQFGTCETIGCTSGISQTATGDGFAAGWANDTWLLDIGTSPLGFKVVNWVGAAGYSSSLNQVSWTLLASRRSLTNSLLSYSGTQDPNTGIVWGGVVASGLNLALSYDKGEANGFWSNLAVNSLTGKNVANNQRIRLMDGYYYKFINEDNRRATIGLNNMIWHYQKDLSGYTLGQGGYYSPQFYLSFGLPIYYRKRTENWSFEMGGTGTWSTATTKNSLLYPLPNLLPISLRGDNTLQNGGTSSGLGYSALFIVERRLNAHFFVGGGIDLQRSRDYTPSNAILYVRYSLNGWKGDLDSPPRPLIPYADFR